MYFAHPNGRQYSSPVSFSLPSVLTRNCSHAILIVCFKKDEIKTHTFIQQFYEKPFSMGKKKRRIGGGKVVTELGFS